MIGAVAKYKGEKPVRVLEVLPNCFTLLDKSGREIRGVRKYDLSDVTVVNSLPVEFLTETERLALKSHRSKSHSLCDYRLCGKLFRRKNKQQKFCSEECKVEEYKAIVWDKKPTVVCAHPDCSEEFKPRRKDNFYCNPKCFNSAYRIKLRNSSSRVYKTCGWKKCKKRFLTNVAHQKFCSTTCAHRTRGQRKLAKFLPKICEYRSCLNFFVPRSGLGKFCSSICRHCEERGSEIVHKVCGFRGCDTGFWTSASRKEFCSKGCYQKEQRRRRRVLRAGNCLWCGTKFYGKSLRRKYCEDKCKKAMLRRKKKLLKAV